MRKKVIAGNWKMNKSPLETEEFMKSFPSLVKDTENEVILCVPYVDLFIAMKMAKGTNVKIGAQNVHFEEKGAFTGEVSPKMLQDIGVEYVIIGHSERRQYFGETSVTVNNRVKAALENGLKVIMCVGESLEEREFGITENVVAIQTKIGLNGISKEDMSKVIIAYEPVWAIGTGKTATSAQANEVNHCIRKVIATIYDEATANKTTIQYGGSMNAGNASELLSKEDIDGGLIGGASLKAQDFATIVDVASK